MLQKVARCCFISCLCIAIITGSERVIDIFTNYPNTDRVLQEYNRLLQERQTKAKSTLPEGKGKIDVDETSRGSYNYYNYDKYDSGYSTNYYDNRKYWDQFHDFNEYQYNHQGNTNNDILESEFGVFDDSPSNHHSNYHLTSYSSASSTNSENTIIPQAQIFHLNNVHNLIGLMARPTFQTSPETSGGNRRNTTYVYDQIDFHHEPTQGDASLESDFGEIVVASTAHRKQPPRKSTIKKLSKPTQPPKNTLHIKKLASMPSKAQVTNLVRRYLVKMHQNRTNDNGNRTNRKQTTTPSADANEIVLEEDVNDVDDRMLSSWLLGDKKTEFETNVKIHQGQEKFLGNPLSGFETIKNKTKQIANKFLSLFTIIQFANFKCLANSASSQYEGTCLLAADCADRNGIAMGQCAEGHGVCCVFRGSCGGVGSNNCTYFESPGYPNYYPQDGGVVIPTSTTMNPLTPDPRLPRQGRQSETANALSCIFRVYKVNDNIKQMRIDFIDLELAGPTAGQCVNEQLIISGSGLTMTVPILCGYNTGQHVNVDVSMLTGPLQIAVLANTIQRKRFKIRICQYDDGCSGIMNCLQSYTGTSGVITSFNYEQASSFSRSTPSYLNNLNYAICIRREPGYCTVTYRNVGPNGVVYPFELRNYDEDGSLSVPAGQAGAGVINCPDDYIVINGIRLCGDRLNDGSINDDFSVNAPVTDTSGGPIIIPVRTNSARVSRGFKLFYMQNRCTTGGGTPDPRIRK